MRLVQGAVASKLRRCSMRNGFHTHYLRLALASLLAIPLWAHHSITAEFDTSKSFTVKGTLTKIEWVNPHAYIYVEAKDDKGVATAYSLETGPPGNLRKAGVLRTMLSVGDAVTIEAYA